MHDVEGWCRAIGAKRAAAYLDATAALFPRGRVPRDDMRRFDIREALSDGGSRTSDPLARLDRKYAGAVDEMVDALRDYLRAHSENPVDALEELARPSRKRRSTERRRR